MAEHKKFDFTKAGGDVGPKKPQPGGLAADIKRNVNAKQQRLDEIRKAMGLPVKKKKKS